MAPRGPRSPSPSCCASPTSPGPTAPSSGMPTSCWAPAAACWPPSTPIEALIRSGWTLICACTAFAPPATPCTVRCSALLPGGRRNGGRADPPARIRMSARFEIRIGGLHSIGATRPGIPPHSSRWASSIRRRRNLLSTITTPIPAPRCCCASRTSTPASRTARRRSTRRRSSPSPTRSAARMRTGRRGCWSIATPASAAARPAPISPSPAISASIARLTPSATLLRVASNPWPNRRLVVARRRRPRRQGPPAGALDAYREANIDRLGSMMAYHRLLIEGAGDDRSDPTA